MNEVLRFLGFMVIAISATLVIVLIALGIEKLLGLF